MKPAENAAAIELMKEEKKPNDKPQQGFESIFFNTARNLIYDELGYHVTQGLLYSAGAFFEQASRVKRVAVCECESKRTVH